MGLFRQEVIENRRPKLYGDVVIPTHLSHLLLSGLFLLLLAMIASIGAFGSFSKSEQVLGRLVPTKGLVKVKVTRPGTLKQLYAHEGDKVKKGALLAVIDTALIGAGGQSVQQNGVEAIDGRLTLLTKSKALEEERLKADLSILDAKVEEQERGLEAKKQSLRLNQEIMASSKQTYEDAGLLQSKGHISRIEFESRKQAYLLAQQKVGDIQQDMEIASTTIRSLGLERERREIEFRKTLGQIDAEMLSLQHNRAEMSGEGQSALRAPVAGTITSVVPVVGDSVSAQDAIVTILPDGGNLQAELLVPSRAIGFVKAGQEVRLAVDAFPYQQYGMVKARVASVTRSMLLPGEMGARGLMAEPAYRVLAALDSDKISFGGSSFLLRPDMRLDATIVLGRLSVIDWLLEPLKGMEARS